MANIRKWLTGLWAQYAAVSLAVMLPLLLPGYILTLDLVFAPTIPWPAELSNTYVFNALLHIVNLALPADVIEKIILWLILILSGVGAHKLVGELAPKSKFGVWVAYFAGLFYMFNPFVYSRFMSGQYLVLLGYALTPFFVRALLKFIAAPNWRSALTVAAWAAAIIGVSVHHIGLLFILAVAIVVAAAWNYRKQMGRLKRLLLFSLISILAVVVVHSFWLIPSIFGATQISQAASSFGQPEFEAFATSSGPLGAIGNVVRLQGFWAEARNMYTMPQQAMPLWGLAMLFVWVLVISGAVRIWRQNSALALALLVVGIAALVLAATPAIAWLADYFPFAAGYREPHKFVALLALVYVIFGSFGMLNWLEKLTKKHSSKLAVNTLISLCLVLPLICAPTMLWGFNGQLKPKNYPADWYTANQLLRDNPAVTKVLFVPWHQYIGFSFSERIIANPAAKFFSVPTVVGDNPEYLGVRPTVPNVTNRRVEQALTSASKGDLTLGAELARLGFSHILLAKEYDYNSYDYLNHQPGIALVNESPTLKIYRIGDTNE